MRLERRVLLILILLFVIAVPAAVLRALCLGRSCAEEQTAQSTVPFCSLPADLRDRIAAGYREGRSPDILAVTRPEFPLAGGGRYDAAPWPSLEAAASRVPLLFYGRGVNRGVMIPAATGLDDISPTIASIIGFDIPHPEVRSGRPIEGVANGERPRLVVIAVLHGASAEVLSDGVMERFAADGASAPSIDPGSLPLDRAALTATIGTGGLPLQHGVTGSLVRNDEGRLVKSWDEGFPGTVIATLSDDLDEELRQKPKIGLVAGDPRDRGLVGGDWYVDTDQDELAIADPASATVPRTRSMMAEGFGDDDVPDVLAVSVSRDDTLATLWRSADRVSGSSALLVVTALPPDAPEEQGPKDIVHQIDRTIGAPVIKRAVPGGFFLDQDVLAQEQLTKDNVVAELRTLEATDGRPLFADVFPGIAVSLGEFC